MALKTKQSVSLSFHECDRAELEIRTRVSLGFHVIGFDGLKWLLTREPAFDQWLIGMTRALKADPHSQKRDM
jgi:hypothetical protein